MERIYTDAFRLKKLKTLVERGVFAVPELQREFVWSARKACDLLDSIYRNYPIGTILIWKTNRRNEGQLRKHLHILPPFNAANRDVYFLVDGQQRLSVLWHIMRGEAASVLNADRKEVHFGRIFFDPYTPNCDSPFVYRKRLLGEMADRLVPVVDMLSSGWRHRIRNHRVRALGRIAECRNRILNYQALMVFCETNDLAEVRETFVRINSLGIRIGAADRAFARASKFNMRGLVRDAQSRLGHGFGRISPETILQTIALAMGGRDVGERAIDAMISKLEKDRRERARFERIWPVLRESFGQAVDYLVYEFGVANLGFLPSEPMITTLALFFLHNRNARPSRAAKRRLQKWFWATAVGARYSGRGHRTNILADASFAERLAANPQAQVAIKLRVPLHILRTTEYGRPGPLSNAFFCLLRLKQPRYLEDGAEIPLGEISTRSNRSDKHHVFPRALLLRHGIGPDRFNCILNICYLVARENQSVGQRAPRYYLGTVPRSRRALALALRSHLIPSVDGEGVWDRGIKRGFKSFLDARARLLVKAFEAQAGMRLFERA
jgi:hypothetical protein